LINTTAMSGLANNTINGLIVISIPLPSKSNITGAPDEYSLLYSSTHLSYLLSFHS
jgi:hypothetical protein